jgi:SAM-dependent methyltransferase
MGISRGAIALIGRTLAGRARGGRALTFGVQRVEAGVDHVRTVLGPLGAWHGGDGAPAQAAQDGSIHQDALFRLLGFDEVESLDYYDAEHPTHVCDLNRPLPPQLAGRFDLVYDGGTLEHCFNTSQVLANVVEALSPGGRVIHHVPANNWVDHGFFQFSPTMFFDFYHANGFGDLAMKLHFMTKRDERYIDYDPIADPSLPYSLGNGAKCLNFFTAVKAGDATGPIVHPIQRRYRETFGAEAGAVRKRGLQRLKASVMKRTLRMRAHRL